MITLNNNQSDFVLDLLSTVSFDLQAEIIGYEKSVDLLSNLCLHADVATVQSLLSDTRQRLLGVIELQEEINRQMVEADLEGSVTSNEYS